MKPFQPYPRLEEKYFPEFLKRGKRYFVSQSYPPGQVKYFDKEKVPIVFTLYCSLVDANVHYDAVKKDKYASIIDLEKPAHQEKVKSMLQPDSKYDVYISMVWKNEKIDAYIKKQYSTNVERYISKSTSWRIPRIENVDFALKIIFGEPFMEIKWRNNTLQVRFQEIENA
jgi:hypothetical protein